MTIRLKVLVNEVGKVVRVVADEGQGSPDIEAAAINAVLRWTYRPGQEYGRPIKAWVTESFTFSKGADPE